MMYRTATIQVNLDFASEADMVQKLRVSLALQPIATALFAASPFTEGKPNGFLSLRSEVWRDTDPNRTGLLPFVFEGGMSFDRYVEYALDVPMYFVYRDGQYIDVAGASFRDFLAGKLAQKLQRPELAALEPTIDDWSDHITTIFPEVRMKRFLEMRGADGGPLAADLRAAGVLGRAALRPDSARCGLGSRQGLVGRRTADALRNGVPRTALNTPFRRMKLLDIAREVTAMSSSGLKSRGAAKRQGQRRAHLPRAGRGDRRLRPHHRRGSARRLRDQVGPQHRSHLHRVRVLITVARPSRTSAVAWLAERCLEGGNLRTSR